jgi:serine phosphatase RsbU (regulator of sigma subunit)
MNKKLNEIELNDSIKEAWGEIVEKVLTEGEKISAEIDFPSVLGKRIMSVNAIPEIDADTDEIESVLVVSHDITEQKEIENEIVNKNKKINDSINYAERIQEAILPDSVIMDQTFDDSFIYYKPRDVVSGDFPWFMKKGDDIYLAAVDCTGHGVPGALISIVGFFLLNDIVGSRGFTAPGEILDNLDKLVTSTFKQDQESSKIKDGMDIAFCKINLKTRIVEFSGAHRPLYVTRATGEFEEVKASKFPIGGGNAYTNKTNFENNVIHLNIGDSIYFFSDGFPDQFGGSQNRKFGPKRIRQVLEDTMKMELSGVRDEFDKQFMEWKGDGKQTDDVLMIGIRF